MDKMICSINEAAKATGATYNFIYNLCKDNKIAYARSGKKYLVNMGDHPKLCVNLQYGV